MPYPRFGRLALGLSGALMIATALATAGVAAAQADPCASAATATEGPIQIQARAGQRFAVKLDSNRTTGFSWSITQAPDAAVVRPLSDDYIPPAVARPGAGGQQCFTFAAVGAGRTAIQLSYFRPFEANVPPARTATVDVTVAAAGGPLPSQLPATGGPGGDAPVVWFGLLGLLLLAGGVTARVRGHR
jgi:predicted secreted protein